MNKSITYIIQNIARLYLFQFTIQTFLIIHSLSSNAKLHFQAKQRFGWNPTSRAHFINSPIPL